MILRTIVVLFKYNFDWWFLFRHSVIHSLSILFYLISRRFLSSKSRTRCYFSSLFLPLPNDLASAPTVQSLTLLSSQPSINRVDLRMRYSIVVMSLGFETDVAVLRKVERMSK